jgi:hypothetical protein
MPPVSYIIAALALAGIVAGGLYATHGYAIFLFYWGFGAAAVVLALFGIVRISQALATPIWVPLVLISPLILWAAARLRDMFASPTILAATSVFFSFGEAIALTAAAIGCIRLIELVSAPNSITRIAYGILAIVLLIQVFSLVQYAIGATWTRSPAYIAIMGWLRWPVIIAPYGAFIAAPVIVVVRRNIEWWVLIPIVGAAVWRLYPVVLGPRIFGYSVFDGVLFWLQPVIFFIAAAAVWRIGSVLRAGAANPHSDPVPVAAE